MVDLDSTGREREKPEAEVRKEIKYPWVYDCTFRDTLFDPDMVSFVDIARCEFEAKLKDDKWRHFFISYNIKKLDREMDVMKGFSKILEWAVSKGEINEGSTIFKIFDVRPVEVPGDKNTLLMKNRAINILKHHDEAEDEAMIQKILKSGVGARQDPTGGKV